MANNLQTFDNADRKQLADSPVMWNFFVAAYAKRGDLVVEVRNASDAADAEDRATKALVELGKPTGATLSDVYAATGDGRNDNGCKPPARWDPITQTCVPE
jgi:hypothetical protein